MPAVTPPSRPTLRARYDHRQQIVIDAAAREFAARGFHATSLQHLMSATGLTAGGLYHYFSSKDELLVMICDRLMEPLLERVRLIVAAELSAVAQLREILRLWVAHVLSHRDHMLVFQQERHVLASGPQWRRVHGQRKEFERLLAEVLERAERAGEARFSDRDLALRALLGMVNHTAMWLRPGGRLTAEQIADGYLELLLGSARNGTPLAARAAPAGASCDPAGAPASASHDPAAAPAAAALRAGARIARSTSSARAR
jgi:AcrR family transcriptional regulator